MARLDYRDGKYIRTSRKICSGNRPNYGATFCVHQFTCKTREIYTASGLDLSRYIITDKPSLYSLICILKILLLGTQKHICKISAHRSSSGNLIFSSSSYISPSTIVLATSCETASFNDAIDHTKTLTSRIEFMTS